MDAGGASVSRPPGLEIHRDPQLRRLWATGFLWSLVRWLEILVFGVFTYQQTESAFWVASMTMLRMLPLALFGVALGAAAARMSRRSGLVASQGALLVTAVVLWIASSIGALEVWHLAVASFINGAAWAADMPVRRGLIGDIAGPQRMGQAMAIDAVANNVCRLVGPGLGGLLLAGAGMPAVFGLTSVLYVAVLGIVLGLVERRPAPSGPGTTVRAMFVSGFQAARDTPALRATLWVTVLFNLFGWPVLSMVPVIGHEQLGLGTRGIGVLAGMDGVGSLVGALALGALARRAWYGRLYVGGVFLFFAGLPAFALSTRPLLTAAALAVIGVGQASFAILQSTLVYVAAPAHQRPQAMGLLTMCIGTAPLGFLTVGWLAERLGAPMAAVSCAAVGLGALLLSWRWWRPCLA